jgi:hypothetical protein
MVRVHQRAEEVAVYVIIETDNEQRGGDALVRVFGPFPTEEVALDVNADLRAELPDPYETHEDYPADFTVMPVLDMGEGR